MKAARSTVAVALALIPAAAFGQACPPDCNGDGKLDIQDFSCFQNKFALADPYADCNKDGVFDIQDFTCFQNQFALGCPSPPASPMQTELAGMNVTGYPFFRFDTAFNAGTPVGFAVDPSRVPGIGGKTGDVYVVANKTAAQWSSSPALVDVRGGPQAVTFFAGSIAANRFLLTGSSTLSGSGGLNLGIPYDLVVDVNRNGVLDGGDLIDGMQDAGGFYVVQNIAAAGPLATSAGENYTVTGVTAGFTSERLYYPSGIASMGKLPLVVISHGNGHQYTWYDYLQTHLASYGYVVISHQNNTGPGIETASQTTLEHTDAFLGQLASIAGGVLVGHVDADRICWIGHSRGGDGIARAYDRLFDGTFVPVNYQRSDIKHLTSISPTDFLGPGSSDPHDANFHLLYGAADGDVRGSVASGSRPFALYERGNGLKNVNYLQGVGHNEFNCCGFADATGPALIGRPAAQEIAKGAFLASIKFHLDGNIPARDYLIRHYEDLRPPTTLQTAVVEREFQLPVGSANKRVIDDFQTQTATTTSSSGGAVTATVANLVEAVMRDLDSSFTWQASDPMSGMTRGTAADVTRGAVFEWTADGQFLEFDMVPALRDFSQSAYLDFRACQMSRHPLTTAALGDVTFAVTLRDGAGVSATINIGTTGAGIEEPYQRTGDGTGAGWQNEFETIRLRLADFQTDGNNLNLGDIRAVRFTFGASTGSASGRLGFDEVVLTRE